MQLASFYIKASDRKKIPDSDFAGPGRTFPIRNQSDLDSAAHLVGRAKDPEAVKRKIIRIAKRKGLTLPESWTKEQDDSKLKMSQLIADLSAFASFAKGNIPEMSANAKRDFLSTQLYDAFDCQYWLCDVYDAYIIACEYEGMGCEYNKIPYTIEADFSVTWGTPQAVMPETIYHPVPDKDDDEAGETAEMSAETSAGSSRFSGGINSVGFKKSNIVAGDYYVYDDSILFEVGEYPDKNFSLTWAEADEAISKFEPVPLNLEHAPDLLKGKVGRLEDVWLDGNFVKGKVIIPKWLDDQFTDEDRKLSAEWTLDDKSLVGLAITATPRVESAALISAYSAYSNSSGKSQPPAVAVPEQEGSTPKGKVNLMTTWEKFKALFKEAGIKVDEPDAATTNETTTPPAEDKEKAELIAFKAQVITAKRAEVEAAAVRAFGAETDAFKMAKATFSKIEDPDALASLSAAYENIATAQVRNSGANAGQRAGMSQGQQESIAAAFGDAYGSEIAKLPDTSKAEMVAAFSAAASLSRDSRAKLAMQNLKEKGVLN